MRFGVGLFSLQCTAMQPTHWARAYREMREHAVLLEDLGYDELWLSEHHFFYDGYCPALLPAAASVLSVTERLRVGTGMLLLPMQDPHRLAAVAQDLNARSGGRLDVGVGLGYRDVEFDGHGVSRKQRLPRMLKGLEVLEAAEKAGGPKGPPFRVAREQSLAVPRTYKRMRKNKSKSTGPMTMQPGERGAIMPIQGLPVMPSVGKPAPTPQPKRQPTRTEAVRAAQAKTMRRNSLRKQRDAQKGNMLP